MDYSKKLKLFKFQLCLGHGAALNKREPLILIVSSSLRVTLENAVGLQLDVLCWAIQ